MKKSGLCFFLFLTLLVTISGCADLYDYLVFKPLQLPKTTGQYGVGTLKICLTDPERNLPQRFSRGFPPNYGAILVSNYQSIDCQNG